VLEQDYDRLEVIAIDDGSQDATPRLLARIADRVDPVRFRWLRHENIGQAATFNRGLEESRGDLLGYLSSDDYLLPGAVSRLVAAADQYQDVDIVYPWFQVVDLLDRVIDTAECYEHTFVGTLSWSVCQPGVGALMRRSCYERIGGWDTSYRFAPDFEWWLRARDARFLRVPEVLGAFRVHEGSMTARGWELEKTRERLRLLDEFYANDDLPDDVLAVKHQAYAATLIVAASILDGPGLGAPDRRFVVEDRLGPIYYRKNRESDATDRLLLARSLRSAEGQLSCAFEKIDQLEQTVTVLEDAARWREQRIARLEAEVARLRTEDEAVLTLLPET
jgi:glycosyltransferase involved in cell wall biosynthesis